VRAACSGKSGHRLRGVVAQETVAGQFATVQATEEAVINAMVAAETITGVKGHTVIALPHDRLRELLKKYNRQAK
jgi:D-aminopeptidase